MKETFARSSVSCLTGADLQSLTASRGDPCWQVTQQLHLLIEKVTLYNCPPVLQQTESPVFWNPVFLSNDQRDMRLHSTSGSTGVSHITHLQNAAQTVAEREPVL